MANSIRHCFLQCFIIFLVSSDLLVLSTIAETNHEDHVSSDKEDNHINNNMEMINYNLQPDNHHHIVKRKSKIGRGFGFGKKTKNRNKNTNPYPKQPGYNPNSNPYPKQPAYNPNYNPGYMNGGSNMGPPPAYPGLNNQRFPSANVPNYPQPGYGYNMGNSYKHGGFPSSKHRGGLGKTIGSAGFGALAGTALGAYGGYKLGRMVGSLGRGGYYGYYDDHGRYMRCDPPKNIKFDPETNITYIPLEDDYDKRCSYYDRRPPMYYTSSARSVNHPMNQLISSIVNLTLINTWELLFNYQLIGFLAALYLFVK